MDYVAIVKFSASLLASDRDAALARRAAWQYPEGIEVIAEYWPIASDVQAISIFRANDIAPILQMYMEWSDAFDFDIHPAVSVADGIRIGAEVFGRLSRYQT